MNSWWILFFDFSSIWRAMRYCRTDSKLLEYPAFEKTICSLWWKHTSWQHRYQHCIVSVSCSAGHVKNLVLWRADKLQLTRKWRSWLLWKTQWNGDEWIKLEDHVSANELIKVEITTAKGLKSCHFKLWRFGVVHLSNDRMSQYLVICI